MRRPLPPTDLSELASRCPALHSQPTGDPSEVQGAGPCPHQHKAAPGSEPRALRMPSRPCLPDTPVRGQRAWRPSMRAAGPRRPVSHAPRVPLSRECPGPTTHTCRRPPPHAARSCWRVRAHPCLHHMRQERRPLRLTSEASPGDPAPSARLPATEVGELGHGACWPHPLPRNAQLSRGPDCLPVSNLRKQKVSQLHRDQAKRGGKSHGRDFSHWEAGRFLQRHKATWQVCLFKKRSNVNDKR